VVKSGVDAHPSVERLRRLTRLLENAFTVPGIGVRFGWDAIIGLVPWAGDVTAALMGGAVIVQAYRIGVPRIVQLRMLLNIGIDVLVGVVPIFGDVADVFWRASTKNLALLEQHARHDRPDTRSDWLFVAGALTVVALLAVVPVVVLLWFLSVVVERGVF
jgi:hypothetical protein